MKIKKFNCAPKVNEYVELPTREQVSEICSYLKPKVVDQIFLINDLIRVVGLFVARRFRVNALHAEAYEVDPTELNLNAYYDPDRDELNKPSIEVVLVTNPNDKHLILDEELWELFVRRLADSLAHELIHMYQARARDFLHVEHRARHNASLDENLVYLSNPDEIDAYAFNIATELREHPNPLNLITSPTNVRVEHSVNLWAYIQAFNRDVNNYTIKQLLKKVYKHLTH